MGSILRERRSLILAVVLGIVGLAKEGKAYDTTYQLIQYGGGTGISGVWMTEINKYGELIRIDFGTDGTYKRFYKYSPTDITIETGRFEVHRNGSVRLFNIKWTNPKLDPNSEETLDRMDDNTLAMHDSQKSILRRR